MEKIDRQTRCEGSVPAWRNREAEALEQKMLDKLDEIVDWINKKERNKAETFKEAMKSAGLALEDNDTGKAIDILELWVKEHVK